MAMVLMMGTLFSQAQINYCDSMTATGAQTQLVLQVNNVNSFIDYWCTNSNCGSLLAEDSMSLTHTVYNSQGFDTITTCITYGMGVTTTCCVEWIWDGTSWAKMMMQQPYFCCDSITYWTDQSQGFNIGLDTSGIVHNPDSMDIWWQVCTNGLCYAGQGMYDYFPQVMTTDTLKVCYDVYLYENGVAELCNRCDTLIFDQNTFSWVLFSNQGNSVSINEFIIEGFNDGEIYDIMGREVFDLRKGVMYIRNNKKFIIVK